MEDVKNKMPIDQKQFFTNLEKYLDAPLYYFGSVQRYDYYPNYSDIDAVLFTNNADSSISQLQNWFQVSKDEFKKTVNYVITSKRMIHGHKFTYKNEKQNLSVDILIYNKKDEEYVKKDCQAKKDIPFYITAMLLLLKTLYYQVGILPEGMYWYSKQIINDILDDGIDFWKIQSHTWKFVTFVIPKKTVILKKDIIFH